MTKAKALTATATMKAEEEGVFVEKWQQQGRRRRSRYMISFCSNLGPLKKVDRIRKVFFPWDE